MLVERSEDWTADELESREERVVKPEAWERLHGEKERELARLVEEGVLQGRGKVRSLKVNAGSFYDWLDEETPAYPD